MSPEERSLLERTYRLVEENNEILVKLRRASRISMAVKAIYWIVIIGLSVGAFYFIQPYVEFITNGFGFGGDSNTSAAADNKTAAQNYIDSFQDLLK